MPRVAREFLASYPTLVSSPTMRDILIRLFLLVCLVVLASPTLRAQFSCPAPWNSAMFVYGTAALKSNETVTSGNEQWTTNQLVSMGMDLFGAPGVCGWTWAQGSIAGGASDTAVVNDQDIANGICLYASSGGGNGISPTAELIGFPGSSQLYFVDQVNVNISEPCGSGSSTPFQWGPQAGLPTISALPSGPVFNGSIGFMGTTSDPGTLPTNWNLAWNLSPVPDKTCKRCKKKLQRQSGSEIDSRNQSLEEDIPIVGTPFFLHYESDRQLGRAGADAVAIMDGFQFGGWTLSVHHALEPLFLLWCIGGLCTPYAVVPKALYMGDGETRADADVQAAVALNGNNLLTSGDGSEVYEFDGLSNRHVSTLLPMTGAKLYTFGYDAQGYLVTVTDASGNVTTIQRNAKESPTAIVGPFGQKTTLTVDANGYLSQVTDPLGRVTKLKASSTGLLASLTDPKGNVYPYQYDTYGQLSLHSDPAGGFISLAHTDTATGFSVSEKTAMGITSGFNVVLSNTATSTTEQYTNTWPNGLVAKGAETQLGGEITESTTLPDGSSYSDMLSSDPRWGIQVPVDNSSKVTLGNLTMNSTSTRAATLGTAGNPFSLTSESDTDTINGRKYSSVFTGSDRTFVDTTPVGRKATTVLDSLERISSAQLGTLLPVQYVYDAHGRLSTAIQGTRKTTFTYNGNDFLASVTDPLDLTDSFTYDADGHVLTKTFADGRVIKFTYDANGNLSSLTPQGKSAHTFAYNTVNFPSTYTPPVITGAGDATYAYDKDQNLTTITRPDTKIIKFNYDTAGRLSQVVAPTETVNLAYNATTGNLASASIPSGESIAYGYNGPLPTSSTWSGTVAGSVSRTFNNNFWTASQSLNGANTINFTYDNDGLVTKAGAMTITNDPNNGLITATTLGSVTDTRIYNTFGELTGYTAKYKTTTLYAVTYTRDADGRIASKVETINGKTTTYVYAYDKAGRLTGVTQNGTSSSKYTYDTNSNRLTSTTSTGSVTGTYDAQDRLLTYGASTFTYTANGELASQKSGTQTTQYQYDVLGNLVSVTLPNATKLTYLVDPENHRVAKQVDGTQQTGYLYDGDQIVAQLNGSNQIVSQFVYATGMNGPDYMVNGVAIYRVISDQLGSPRLVVNTATGTVAEQMNYDEFGNVLADSDAGFQPFGFAGGLKDPDTGFVRFGARDYNPVVGRWALKDPILFQGGDSNLFGYTLDDPINKIDPAGLEDPCPCKAKNFFWGAVDEFTRPAISAVPGGDSLVVKATGTHSPGEAIRNATGSSADEGSLAYYLGGLTADLVAALIEGLSVRPATPPIPKPTGPLSAEEKLARALSKVKCEKVEVVRQPRFRGPPPGAR
jgi:RHS repeat-associated protein